MLASSPILFATPAYAGTPAEFHQSETRVEAVAQRLAVANRALCVAPTSCRLDVVLVEDEAVNAWADGNSIRITTGLLARCRSDEDLALVLGHEMAHNLLRHRQRLAGRGGASGLLPSGEVAARELHDTEEEADRVAVSLAMAAGYDLGGAVAFMDSLLDRSLAPSETHPGPERRLALLRQAISEALRDRAELPGAN